VDVYIDIFLTPALVVVSGQLHVPAALPLGKEPPGTHWIGGLVGPRTGLEDVEKRNFLNLPVLEL
jgi:hypothetical protein